jgi:ribonucleoside-diphosphate reductase alpha chain
MDRRLKTASSLPAWRGVRLRQTHAAADPDAPPRDVALPAGWDEGAAAALAELVPGSGPVALPAAAEAWIGRIAGTEAEFAERLRALLLARRGAPSTAVWHGTAGAPARFVLNLAAFHDPAQGFDRAGFAQAVATATRALAAHDPTATRLAVCMADIAGLLSALGLDYASDEAQAQAALIARLMAQTADATAATLAGRAFRALTGVAAPDATEALLGAETGGIAPAFSPLDDAGRLTRAAQAWLAARGMTAETALASVLGGGNPFPQADAEAHAAMHAAVAPYVDAMPAMPPPLPALAPAAHRRELPARHASVTQRASVGGHRVFLRVAEYADGAPGEIAVSLPKDSTATRGLMDAFAQAVSLGLQHGVPLAEFVDAFTLTRFGAAGPVEGDPAVAHATSVLDYVFRSLAARYMGGARLPEAEPEEAAPAPLLPLDLPPPRQRGLRVVK